MSSLHDGWQPPLQGSEPGVALLEEERQALWEKIKSETESMNVRDAVQGTRLQWRVAKREVRALTGHRLLRRGLSRSSAGLSA